MADPLLRVVLYVRLSVSDDASTSVARQESDLRELAARECWEVARVLVDDGFSGRKARANAAEALRMLAARDADVLAVWKFDRWSRQGIAAVGDLVSTLDATPGASFVALRDGLRSDQPAWRIIASVLSEVARMEAENTAMRVRSSLAALRKAGRFGGGTVPFGYTTAPAADGPGRILVPVAEEAALVREVVARILEGETATSIASDLTARGVATTRSPARAARIAGKPTSGLDAGRWTTNTLQMVVTSETLLGRRMHRGVALVDDGGLPLQVWEPILDLRTLALVRARVRNPRARASAAQPAPRTRAAQLLSGLVYCAHCGGKMYANTSGSTPVYACPKRLDAACPGPRMTVRLVDSYVTEWFLRLDGTKPHREDVEVVSDPRAADALSEIEAALRYVSAAIVEDDADVPALLARMGALKTRRAELRTEEAVVTVERRKTGRTIREQWDAVDHVEARRTQLREAIDHVTISRLPEGKARKGFHPERIRIVENADADPDYGDDAV